ncbi:MAG TPA: MmcQ/YjbR family DNA-binding protein [Caulobacteraceae bacterium]|nr:MmcQ/YjbR family DNA-binding protein [Caulobacteraceae bacterium]
MSPEEARALALALPDAVEADHHGMPSFRVGSRIFATLRTIPARLMVKLDPEDQANLVAGHPDVITPVPGYWGRKGSTFVDLQRAEKPLVAMLLDLAWRNVAPARLVSSAR